MLEAEKKRLEAAKRYLESQGREIDKLIDHYSLMSSETDVERTILARSVPMVICLFSLAFSAAAIGGLVVVGQMLHSYGTCAVVL